MAYSDASGERWVLAQRLKARTRVWGFDRDFGTPVWIAVHGERIDGSPLRFERLSIALLYALHRGIEAEPQLLGPDGTLTLPSQ